MNIPYGPIHSARNECGETRAERKPIQQNLDETNTI